MLNCVLCFYNCTHILKIGRNRKKMVYNNYCIPFFSNNIIFPQQVRGFKSHKPGFVRLEVKVGMCKEKTGPIVCVWLQSADPC